MWTQTRIWIAATAIAIGSIALLLISVGVFLDLPRVVEERLVEPDESYSPSSETCTFRVSGTVKNSDGQPIESAIIELKEDGPFATTGRTATTNYAGRFLYTESGYGTCFMEDLFPTVLSQGHLPWSRDTAVTNNEAFEIVLSLPY